MWQYIKTRDLMLIPKRSIDEMGFRLKGGLVYPVLEFY